MRRLNNILLLLAALFYIGCTLPDHIDPKGDKDNIENNNNNNNNGGGGNTPGDDTPGNNTPGDGKDDAEQTSGPYEVGDYYNDGTNEGIVFCVDNHGTHGKIVSKNSQTLEWSTSSAKNVVGASSTTDSTYNLGKVKEVPNWENKFPAFKYCVDRGEDWYLPAAGEMALIYSLTQLEDKLWLCSWSSTECSATDAWYVNMEGPNMSCSKGIGRHCCPVYAF